MNYLTLLRKLDAEQRRSRFESALATAIDARADHLVITGDLTEDGTDPQFELLAATLFDAGVDPKRVTLVPGNHDVYSDRSAWMRALAGPLTDFKETSAPGAVVEVGDAMIVAVSTAVHQIFLTAAGAIDDPQLARLRELAVAHAEDDVAIVIAQHHGPRAQPGARQWVEGLRNHRSTASILAAAKNMTVLHGHSHRAEDRTWPGEQDPRIYSARAVVDGERPIRLYETEARLLRPRLAA